MREFFAGMNLPRLVFLGCMLASAGLGWFVYQDSVRLKEIKLELRRVPKEVQQIQQLAEELNGLLIAAGGDGLLQAQDDAELYIRQTASEPEVLIGQLVVTPSRSRGSRTKGVEDVRYKIEPLSKNTKFSRGQIGNFLYQLEAKSRLVKVTHIKLSPAQKNLKPGEINQTDAWIFEAEVTSRRKVEKDNP